VWGSNFTGACHRPRTPCAPARRWRPASRTGGWAGGPWMSICKGPRPGLAGCPARTRPCARVGCCSAAPRAAWTSSPPSAAPGWAGWTSCPPENRVDFPAAESKISSIHHHYRKNRDGIPGHEHDKHIHRQLLDRSQRNLPRSLHQ